MLSVAIASPKNTAANSQLNTGPSWLRVLHRVNPVLSLTGWLHLGLLVATLVLLPLDGRLVTGAPVWLKPLKFTASIVAYVWTLGWLLADLPAATQPDVRRLSWGVALSMGVEMACIFGQAARGTTSHYNAATTFDGVLFGLMGVFILMNTLLTGWAVYLVWRHRPQGPAGYVWGVRLGLLVFLVGSVLGGMMIHLSQHTVGAPDGGPGLPGLGWSTRAGDLRAAHFLGLHALQLLPLLGWALSRWLPRHAGALIWLGTAGYVAAVAALFIQALRGVPLVRW
ncbi:hypothetical protein KLP40_10870 [Hymenobacter sp. NST-14]|uniref:hypothetical protein n=1 Tax=Hymenobacter piscis TaxID=2839984 RepID=UPI001C034884|nr:hypothetical protein [Hymenobacter piscis]MBT9393665.1 hypothetical protein [Hymenobacter piscis]